MVFASGEKDIRGLSALLEIPPFTLQGAGGITFERVPRLRSDGASALQKLSSFMSSAKHSGRFEHLQKVLLAQ